MKITHLMTEFLSMTKREKEEEGREKGARPPYASEEAAVKGETRGFNRGLLCVRGQRIPWVVG